MPSLEEAVEGKLRAFANSFRRVCNVRRETSYRNRDLDAAPILAELFANPTETGVLWQPEARERFSQIVAALADQYGHDETVEAIRRYGEAMAV